MRRTVALELLALPADASTDEIAAAHARLVALYRPERYLDGPPEFAAQAAEKRALLADALATLMDTPAEPVELVDYRPLPPARGQERTSVPEAPPTVAVPRPKPTRRLPPAAHVALLGGLILGLYLLVSLTNVRTRGDTAALTPLSALVPLPYTAAQLGELERQAAAAPTVEAWVTLGNAWFDNLETLRETAFASPQYQQAAADWPKASAAYRRALTLQDDAVIRSDLALTLVFYAQATNETAQRAEGVREAERARAAAPDVPLVLLNYGLALTALDPPQHDQAAQTWRDIISRFPTTPEAQRAQVLLELYVP